MIIIDEVLPPAIVQAVETESAPQQQIGDGRPKPPAKKSKQRSRRLTNEQRRGNRKKREYQERRSKRGK